MAKRKRRPVNCVFCGSADVHTVSPVDRDAWRVRCNNCGAYGPVCKTASAACEAWNRDNTADGKSEYWSMHWYGTYQRCSRHKSAQAAIKAAQACERVGGSEHAIWECRRIPRRPAYMHGKRKGNYP